MSMLEQSLDAIIGDRPPRGGRDRGRRRDRGRDRGRGRGGDRGRAPAGPRSRAGRVTAESIRGSGSASEVKILNLHPDLTVDDLTKLMQTVGDVVRVEIKYNTHGQSTGVAFVEFKDTRAAQAAIHKFDGRLAAGQVITVTTTLKLADRIGGGVRKDRSGGRSRSSGRGSGRPSKARPQKTLEDLDKELNAYMGVGDESVPELEGEGEDQGI